MNLLLKSILLVLISVAPAIAQQDATNGVADPNVVLDASLANQQQSVTHFAPQFRQRIFWPLINNQLAAKDGNYLAQNEEELQTYYDLKMGYQYIDSEVIRKALNLESGQGIVVESCDESGKGYTAGFRKGDVVLKVKDEPVDTQYDFVIAITNLRKDEEGSATVRRQGKDVRLDFSIDPVNIKKSYRWIIGVSVDEMPELLHAHLGVTGAVVTAITDDSPAEKMSIKVNDIIAKINDSEIANLDDLRKAVQASKGEPVTLDLLRAGNKMTLELTPKKVENDLSIRWDEPAVSAYYRAAQLQNAGVDYFVPTAVDTIVTKANVAKAQTLESLSQQVAELRELVEQLKEAIDK